MTPADHRGLVSLGPTSLRTLRAALERLLGEQSAALLQETGYASGQEMYRAFGSWLQPRANVADPSDLDASFLDQMLSEFFRDIGWGTTTLEQLADSAMALDAAVWAEAGTDTGALAPSCHITTGLLAAFMSELAGEPVAVMQVECLTCGDQRCRFLIGSGATLQLVFEAISRGESYTALLVGTSSAR